MRPKDRPLASFSLEGLSFRPQPQALVGARDLVETDHGDAPTSYRGSSVIRAGTNRRIAAHWNRTWIRSDAPGNTPG